MFFKKKPIEEVEQPAWLISVLLDKSEDDLGTLIDVAMYLSAYDEPEAERALGLVGSDDSTDPTVADECGSSLGEIWQRKGSVKFEILINLKGEALRMALSWILDYRLADESEVFNRLGKTAEELGITLKKYPWEKPPWDTYPWGKNSR